MLVDLSHVELNTFRVVLRKLPADISQLIDNGLGIAALFTHPARLTANTTSMQRNSIATQ